MFVPNVVTSRDLVVKCLLRNREVAARTIDGIQGGLTLCNREVVAHTLMAYKEGLKNLNYRRKWYLWRYWISKMLNNLHTILEQVWLYDEVYQDCLELLQVAKYELRPLCNGGSNKRWVVVLPWWRTIFERNTAVVVCVMIFVFSNQSECRCLWLG